MGQCCSASAGNDTKDHRPPVPPHESSSPLSLNDAKGEERTEEEEEDDWWEAASNLSFQSAISTVTLEDALEEWHEKAHGNLGDLEEEIVEAAREGGHLLRTEIEVAAATGTPLGKKGERPQGDVSKVIHVDTSTAEIDVLRVTKETIHKAVHEETTAMLLEEARESFNKGRAIRAYQKMLEFCQELDLEESDLRGPILKHQDLLNVPLDEIVDLHDAVVKALESIEDDDAFMVSRDDSLRVLYRHERGTTIHSLKLKAVFNHPVENILALAHEWDLLPSWNSFCIEAIKLAEPSIFESFVYGAQWMMTPFKHMQSIVHARGIDLADEHRCLLILVNDVDVEALPEGHAPLPSQMEKRKFVNILPGTCIKLRPLPMERVMQDAEGKKKIYRSTKDGRKRKGTRKDGNKLLERQDLENSALEYSLVPRTEADFVVHLDPHIPMVPSVLVNFVLGILAPYIYSQINRVLDAEFADPNGNFPKRMAEQPELYGFVADRMAEFVDELRIQ